MSDLITTQSTDLVELVETQPLDRNPAAVHLAGLNSKRSQAAQLQALGVLADLIMPGVFVAPERPKRAAFTDDCEYDQALAQYKQLRQAYNRRGLLVNWRALRYQHTAAIRATLAGKYAPATANRLLSALRGTLKEARRLKLMKAEDYQDAVDLAPVKGHTLPAGRALGAGEIAALMASCENDPSPAGPRDAAMIVCMYPGALRRDEVAALDLGDYDPETGVITVRHGKGNKARTTFIENGAMGALADWLAIRGDKPGPLFCAINKGGNLQPGRMTHQAVYNVLAKRGDLAKLRDFSPHDLRRTFISDSLDDGVDISTVAAMVGHASVTTTQRYDRRGETAKQKAAGLRHIPYRRRMV